MNNELYHHGILGQKWGTRRYQNEDGSYKPGAEGRYYTPTKSHQKQTYKSLKKAYKKNHDTLVGNKEFGDRFRSDLQEYMTSDEIKRLEKARSKTNFNNFKKYSYKINGDSLLSDKGLDKFYDADSAEFKECKKVAQRILGKYGDKKVSFLSKDTYADRGASYLQRNILGVNGWDELKQNNPSMRAKNIESDHKSITNQISKKLSKDPKTQKSIQNQIGKQIKDYSKKGYNDSTETWKDGTISFTIDGAKEIGSGQGLDITYNPKTKKVTNIGWA